MDSLMSKVDNESPPDMGSDFEKIERDAGVVRKALAKVVGEHLLFKEDSNQCHTHALELSDKPHYVEVSDPNELKYTFHLISNKRISDIVVDSSGVNMRNATIDADSEEFKLLTKSLGDALHELREPEDFMQIVLD